MYIYIYIIYLGRAFDTCAALIIRGSRSIIVRPTAAATDEGVSRRINLLPRESRRAELTRRPRADIEVSVVSGDSIDR